MFVEDLLDLPLREVMSILHRRIMQGTMYQGVFTYKWPPDAWMYQEILWRCRPDLIIEIGTKFGGSALFLADTMRAADYEGHVLTIDVDQSRVADLARLNDRIALYQGDASAPATVKHVRQFVHLVGAQKVMVIEDSAHTYPVTLACLREYGPLVASGQYFIVEDAMMCKAHNRGDRGPLEAMETFLEENSADWAVDRDMEWPITCNARGYLRRV